MKLLNFEGGSTPITGVLPPRDFSSDESIKLDSRVTSKGNQNKWKTHDGSYYIKECFTYQGKTWKDNLVEVVASQYASLCNLPKGVRVTKQGLCTVNGRAGSYSENFNPEGRIVSTFCRQLLSLRVDTTCAYSRPESILDWMRGVYYEVTSEDCRDYLLSVALLDLIVLNEDRHLNNFVFVQEEDTLVPAPLFDFGLGMFEHDTQYEGMPLRTCYEYTSMKPFARNPLEMLDWLTLQHSDFLQRALPRSVDYSAFTFPNSKAGSYFIFVNRRLGVDVCNY